MEQRAAKRRADEEADRKAAEADRKANAELATKIPR
jgi:hypothetical protein